MRCAWGVCLGVLNAHRVLKHIHELSIRRPHLIGIHHLIPASNLKDAAEELLVGAKLLILEELLGLSVVGREH
jgi:hypothetical protein